MTYALMQNAAGNFVQPEDKAFKAAAAGARMVEELLPDPHETSRARIRGPSPAPPSS